MALTALRDYFRDKLGVGINSASFDVKRLSDNAVVASGSTASDTTPLTPVLGMLSVDETTLGYPGPVKVTVTSPSTSEVRVQTSKSISNAGPIRIVDITRFWQLMGTGAVPNIGGELVCSCSGSNMIVSVASGQYIQQLGEHALMYAWPVARSVTVAAAHASLPRIDTIILRMYPPGVAQEGRIDLTIVAGTAAASPAAPSLTQDITTYWEAPLADIRVDAAVTSLAVGKSTRRNGYCMSYPPGVVSGDLFYTDANARFGRLPAGTAGQYLKIVAGIPAWDTFETTDLGAGLIAVANGGTNAADAATARTNLGLAIGTNVQAWDADLDALALKAVPAGALVGTTDSQTLTNKTLTTPAISSPTGLVKGDVGLGSVDNTSDATKNAAAVTLTNKTITNPVITGGSHTGMTDITVADGGTGASTAAGARTNLGLVIGTDVQAATNNPQYNSLIVDGGFRFGGTNGTPTYTPLGQLGSTGTVTGTAGGDAHGEFTLTAGGTGITSGSMITVTFATVLASSAYDVVISPRNANAASIAPYLSSRGTASFNISFPTAPTSGQAYSMSYLVIGR